jgi:hypothetical protein
MKFDILNEDSGAFSCSAAELAAAASLAELVANCGSKRISKKRFIGLLERYINDTPELFEPYDLLASLYTMEGVETGAERDRAWQGLDTVRLCRSHRVAV